MQLLVNYGKIWQKQFPTRSGQLGRDGFWWTRTGGAYWQQGEDYADLMARYVGSNAYSEMYSSIYLSENYVTSQNVGVRPTIWVSY